MADMAQRATPALGKREGSTLVPEAAKRIKSGVDETVRIWWPPTDSRKRSGYSGMYWPATVVRIMADTCEVEYDNGDKEVVEAENVFPVPTVDFGEETHPFLVGEYVEVFNDSKSDPAAWLAQVERVTDSHCTVSFPFHTTSQDEVQLHLVRRARVFEMRTSKWRAIRPRQAWEDGEVTSPLELDLCSERDIPRLLDSSHQADGQEQAHMLEPGRSGAAEAMHPQDSTPSSLQGKTHQRAYQGTPSPASKVGFDNGLSAQHNAQEGTGEAAAQHRESSRAAQATGQGTAADGRPASARKAGTSSLAEDRMLRPRLSKSPLAPAHSGRGPALTSGSPAAASDARRTESDSQGKEREQHKSTRSGRVVKPKAQFEVNHAHQLLSAEDRRAARAAACAATEQHVDDMEASADALCSDIAIEAGQRAAAACAGQLPAGWSPCLASIHPASYIAPADLPDGMQLVFLPALLSPAGDLVRLHRHGKQAAIKADPDTSPPRNAAGPNTRVKLPTGITPWNVFCQRNRDSVRASRPELDPQEITGQLSHMWKSVGRDERKICSEIAEVNRQGNLEKAMQDASDPSSPAAVAAADSAAADVSQPAAAAPVMQHCEAATQTAAGVLPAPPAQPRTAYMLFTLEFRKALGKNVALEQATALAAGAWNGLSKDKQSPYDHIAAVEKKNFDRAMQQYKEQVSAYGKQQQTMEMQQLEVLIGQAKPGAMPTGPYRTNPATGLPYGASGLVVGPPQPNHAQPPQQQHPATQAPPHHPSIPPHLRVRPSRPQLAGTASNGLGQHGGVNTGQVAWSGGMPLGCMPRPTMPPQLAGILAGIGGMPAARPGMVAPASQAASITQSFPSLPFIRPTTENPPPQAVRPSLTDPSFLPRGRPVLPMPLTPASQPASHVSAPPASSIKHEDGSANGSAADARPPKQAASAPQQKAAQPPARRKPPTVKVADMRDVRDALTKAGISQAAYERLEAAWSGALPLKKAATEHALHSHILGRANSDHDWHACFSDIFGTEEAEELTGLTKSPSIAQVIDLT